VSSFGISRCSSTDCIFPGLGFVSVSSWE
jgi:hypothetical protein